MLWSCWAFNNLLSVNCKHRLSDYLCIISEELEKSEIILNIIVISIIPSAKYQYNNITIDNSEEHHNIIKFTIASSIL